MSIYQVSRQGREAYRQLAIAVEEKGANCKENPERWDGHVDENGVEWLPTAQEAEALCAGCPLLGKECHEALSKGNYSWTVMDGKVIDKWNLSGVDLFAPEEKGD